MTNRKFRPAPFFIAVAVPLAVGGLSALITSGMMKEYFFMNKPPLSPPDWLFPIVWTVLYILMGIASYLVYVSKGDRALRRTGLTVYGIQLFFNFFWSILFFNFALYLPAFLWLLTMWMLIVICTVCFFAVDKRAGWLMIPYILWTGFAAYLNFAVYKLSVTPIPIL